MSTPQYGILRRFGALLCYKFGKRKNQEALYAAALSYVSTDASPDDMAPDELGCAESVSTILNKVVKFPITVSTARLYELLSADTRFIELTTIAPRGTIIISPTGSGNGTIVGHCGIVGTLGEVMANNSNTGNWDYNYTLTSWRERWSIKGGMPVYFFGLL